MRDFLKFSKYAIFWCVFFCHSSLFPTYSRVFNKTSPNTNFDSNLFVDSVNIISGKYSESILDCKVSGPDHIEIKRHYNVFGNSYKENDWTFFPKCFLFIQKKMEIPSITNYTECVKDISIFVCGDSANLQCYTHDVDLSFRLEFMKNNIGFINTHKKGMSGSNNQRDNVLRILEDGNSFELILSNGNRRIYKRCKHNGAMYKSFLIDGLHSVLNLDLEILPSGNKIKYIYNSNGKLSSIKMLNRSETTILSWVNIYYKNKKIEIHTSDKKEVIYSFSNSKLSEVSYSSGYNIKYIYNEKGFLIRKEGLDGRFLHLKYDDFNRVISLQEPLSENRLIERRRFNYKEGHTEIFNSMGYKKSYHYTLNKHLSSIVHFDSDQRPYKSEVFIWGSKEDNHQLNLMYRAIKNSDGMELYSETFFYDTAGLLNKRIRAGNLTGEERNANTDSSATDTIETFIEFSKDTFHLPLKITDCKGNSIILSYIKGTNLISKKLIKQRGVIKNRFFYFYNENASLIKLITDNGTEEEIEKISALGNGTQHILEFSEKKSLPFFGHQRVISENIIQYKNHRKEIFPVSKTYYAFDVYGRITSVKIFKEKKKIIYSIEKEYDEKNKSIILRNHRGDVVKNFYDVNGNIIKSDSSNLNKKKYFYDLKNQLIKYVEEAGNIITSYDIEYDALGRMVSVTDSRERNISCEYDNRGFISQVTYPGFLGEEKTICRPVFKYTNDIFGNPLFISNPKGYTEKRVYNVYGQPLSIIYPDGSSELFKYDPEGTLHRHLARNHFLTVYEYDYLSRLNHKEKHYIDSKNKNNFWIDNQKTIYDAFKIRKQDGWNSYLYKYDNLNRVSSIEEKPKGIKNKDLSRKIEFQYDSFNNVIAKKIWFDLGENDYYCENLFYDNFGKLIKQETNASSGDLLFGSNNQLDDFGKITKEDIFDSKYHNISCLNMKYDESGNLDELQDSYGNKTKIESDQLDKNDLGQTVLKRRIFSPIGNELEIIYDTYDRISKVEQKSITGKLLSSYKVFFDLCGNKSLEQWAIISNLGNVLGHYQKKFYYGAMNQVEQISEFYSNQEKKKSTFFHYDNTGRLVKLTPSGALSPIEYFYGSNGKLIKITQCSNKRTIGFRRCFSYDLRGNVTTATNEDKSGVGRHYNSFNQIEKEKIKDQYGEYDINITYDRIGRIKSIILPDNSKILYSYNSILGKEVIRLSSDGRFLYSHKYQKYNGLNKSQEELILNLGKQFTEYDENGNKCVISNNYYREWIPIEGRNKLGHILKKAVEYPFLAKEYHYKYDELLRLTAENNTSFSYDGYGNITKNGKVEYKHHNNILTECGETKFYYNDNGCLQKKFNDQSQEKFFFNDLNELQKIIKSNKKISFFYDPFGRRIRKEVLDLQTKKITVERYIYVGSHEIGSMDENSKINSLKIPGIFGYDLSHQAVAIEINSDTYAPIYDIQNNLVALIQPENQKIFECYFYSPFGQEIIFDPINKLNVNTSKVNNPWRFSGKRHDLDTGFVFFGLRYYDPNIGRWITPDPIGTIDGFNKYNYLKNNPINYCDHLGLITEYVNSNYFRKYFYGNIEPHCFCERNRKCKRGGNLIALNDQLLNSKIFYDEHFENRIQCKYGKSRLYDLRNPCVSQPNKLKIAELPRGGIGFINGISNSFDDAVSHAKTLSEIAGGFNIMGVYNADHKYKISESLLGLVYDVGTPPAMKLHVMWDKFFDRDDSETKFLMICHSQGAIHVRNALMGYPEKLRNKIIVLAVAPAQYISSQLCDSVYHYASKYDLVPLIDISGRRKNLGSLKVIEPQSHLGSLDHDLESFTYRDILRYHIREYIRQFGGLDE